MELLLEGIELNTTFVLLVLLLLILLLWLLLLLLLLLLLFPLLAILNSPLPVPVLPLVEVLLM